MSAVADFKSKTMNFHTEKNFFSPAYKTVPGTFITLKSEETLPQCGDSITAYHIAKKGLLLVERIKSMPEGEKVSLAVRNEEWLEYIQRTV